MLLTFFLSYIVGATNSTPTSSNCHCDDAERLNLSHRESRIRKSSLMRNKKWSRIWLKAMWTMFENFPMGKPATLPPTPAPHVPWRECWKEGEKYFRIIQAFINLCVSASTHTLSTSSRFIVLRARRRRNMFRCAITRN